MVFVVVIPKLQPPFLLVAAVRLGHEEECVCSIMCMGLPGREGEPYPSNYLSISSSSRALIESPLLMETWEINGNFPKECAAHC